MKITNPSAAYFEAVASQWDELRSGYFSEAVRQAAIQEAHLIPEMIVADVGAGTGFIASGLAPLVRQVYVFDGSLAMLKVAFQNLRSFSNIDLQCADGLFLPLLDGKLDAVFANMYLHHCPNPLAAVQEMVRVLKPGGRLVITDMDSHTHEWLKREMADVWLGFERSQVSTWLEQAGLVNVSIDCTDQCCQANSRNQADERADISIFLAMGVRRKSA